MKRLPIALPILASLASFILVLLALLAGSQPGHMEDYDILTFNTSALGKNLVSNFLEDDEPPSPTETDSSLCDNVGSVLGKVCGSATSAAAAVKSKIVDKLDDIGDDIADKLADRLGIHEFYSLHILTVCDGEFTPNATAPGAGRNVTECRKGLDGGYNITAKLDKELRAGPLHLNVADLGFTADLQDAIDTVNNSLKAVAILFIVSATLVGLSFLCSLIAIFLVPGRRESAARIVNAVIATVAMVVLVVSSVLVTTASQIAVDKINEKGDDIGLNAKVGTKYLVISWVATGVFIVGVFGFWVVQSWRWRSGGAKRGFPKAGGHGYGEKNRGVRRDEEMAGSGRQYVRGKGARGVRWPGRR